MTSLMIGLYGLYFALVGYNGNTQEFVSAIENEKDYVPWLVSLVVLGLAYGNDKTRPIVAPFAGLLLLTVALKPSTSTNVKAAYDYLTGQNTGGSTGTF